MPECDHRFLPGVLNGTPGNYCCWCGIPESPVKATQPHAPPRKPQKRHIPHDEGKAPVERIVGAKEIILELPLPPKGCSPNEASSRHWKARYKAVRTHKEECRRWVYGLLAGWKMPDCRVVVDAEFYCARSVPADDRYRPHDEQNAWYSLKGAIDSLVEAGFIIDDTRKYLTLGTMRIYGTRKEHHDKAGVVLSLRLEKSQTETEGV